eukprot:sb/3464143/
MFDVWLEWSKTYGPIFAYRHFHRHLVPVICGADSIKRVLHNVNNTRFVFKDSLKFYNGTRIKIGRLFISRITMNKVCFPPSGCTNEQDVDFIAEEVVRYTFQCTAPLTRHVFLRMLGYNGMLLSPYNDAWRIKKSILKQFINHRQLYQRLIYPIQQEPTETTNQNSLFRSRDSLSTNQGPVFLDSVGSCYPDRIYYILFTSARYHVSYIATMKSKLKPGDMRESDYSQEPTETSKQPIRARCLGHVTGDQPIRDQQFLIRSVPDRSKSISYRVSNVFITLTNDVFARVVFYNLWEPTETSKKPIRTRYLRHVTGYQPIRHYITDLVVLETGGLYLVVLETGGLYLVFLETGGLYLVFLETGGLYLVVLETGGLYLVVLETGELYLVFLETGGLYLVFLETGGLYLVVLETGGLYLVVLETGGPYLVVLETGGLYLVVLETGGLYLVVLETGGPMLPGRSSDDGSILSRDKFPNTSAARWWARCFNRLIETASS